MKQLRDLGALYSEIDIPAAVSKEAARHVIAFVDLMRDMNETFRMPDFDDLPLKARYYNAIDPHLEVSGNSPARALFYLEFSRLLKGPLLLDPEKPAYLQRISQAVPDGLASVYGSLEVVRK
jgi:hypothetical protein